MRAGGPRAAVAGLGMVLAAALMGCPGSSTGHGGGFGSATVGAAGGTVATANGKASVVIPAGALAADTEISIERVGGGDLPPNLAQAAGPDGVTYRLSPDGLAFPAGTPAVVTFVLEGAATVGGGAVSVPNILVVHESAGTVEPVANLTSSVDPATGDITVTGEIGHFSELKAKVGGSTQVVISGVPDHDLAVHETFTVTLTIRLASKIENAVGDLFLAYQDHAESPVVYEGPVDEGAWETLSAPGKKYNRVFTQEHTYRCDHAETDTETGRYNATVKLWPKGPPPEAGEVDPDADPPFGNWQIRQRDGTLQPSPSEFMRHDFAFPWPVKRVTPSLGFSGEPHRTASPGGDAIVVVGASPKPAGPISSIL